VRPVRRPGPPDPAGPRPYAAGSWGPPASSAMIAREGFVWDEES
jgi:glucose-6-phosphate 1-dehydrogenase